MRQLLALLVIAATVYGIVDCAQSDAQTRRNIPLWVWVLLMVALPGLGTIIWLLVSRLGTPGPQVQQSRPVAPDDDPEFLRYLERRSRTAQTKDDAPPSDGGTNDVDDEPGETQDR